MPRTVASLSPMELRLLRKFLDRTTKSPNCWIWTGGLSKSGYGQLHAPALGERRAHRVSFILHRGAIPDGLLVLHKCDNPRCVNPAHLFLGTPLDNIRDMIAKGRDDKVKGMRHPAAKLTDGDVKSMRRLYASGRKTQGQLCKMYDISRSHMCYILKRVYWKHLA